MSHILAATIILLFFSGYTQALEFNQKAEDDYKVGVVVEQGMYRPPNHKKALIWYIKAAEQGHREAQYRVGEYYKFGHYNGIPQNYREAKKWYRLAAAQGHKDAQRMLEFVLKNPPRENESDANTQYKIAEVFVNKNGNYKEAVIWYRKAADQGHVKAQIKLGGIYYNARGVERDDTEAIKWYSKAAKLGSVSAKRSLIEIQKNIEASKGNNKKLTDMEKFIIATLAIIAAKKLSDSLSSNNNSVTQVSRKDDNECRNRIVSCRVLAGSCDMVGNCNYDRYCDSNRGLFNGDCERSQYERDYYCDPETQKQNSDLDQLINKVCSK